MYINTNGLPLRLNNKIGKTQTNLQKTIDKIATGQKIRSASNDASGLAISQKLLALSRGERQAIQNVQDAGSLVQVADGAMQEMTDIVQRIRELTVQAMNGTNTEIGDQQNTLTTADTLLIQNEVDELKKDLNDIVHNTEFNTMKLLSNETPGEFLYEDRTASKTIQLSQVGHYEYVNTTMNTMGYDYILPKAETSSLNYTHYPPTTIGGAQPVAYVGTTINDHLPRWTQDGQSIVFTSSRDGGQYIVPKDGGEVSIEDQVTSTAVQKTVADNSLMRLRNSGTELILERRSSTSNSWTSYQTYEYNYHDGSSGFSFSPIVENGNTSFVYSDNLGNIKKVNVNFNNQTVTSGPNELIPSSDVLKVPREDNVNKLSLPSSPDLYRMNTGDASLRVLKVNDNGERELTYWDGTGSGPTGGYYTVSGGEIEFFGDAIIGSEPDDDAQDYYKFFYVSDSFQNDIFTTSIPTGAEIYNMHGEMGPRSLSIKVGGTEVTRDQLLSSRPTDANNTTGVFVDEASGKIEFYGNLRPSYLEEVQIEYFNDIDSRNGVQTFSLTSYIDTYNLENPDLTTNRSLRVYVGGEEIAYDASKTNGYTYENGRISLYGDARSDIASNEEVKINYVYDSTSTSKDVYGVRLYNVPEVYNLGSTTSPNSIRVYRNSTEEIEYSNTNGFQYNSTTNTIELYGTSRPDVNDTYSIQMVVPTEDVYLQDGKIEIALSPTPETYGTDEPITFLVEVDGTKVEYDETKTNGFYYNSQTNRIELYGDARPEANNTSNPDVKVSYVYESSSSSRGNDSYDFQLASNTLDYGLGSASGPKAIRVYQNGTEVPYDSENGFSYDHEINRLSLHGSYRPDFDDNPGDFRVYSLTANDLVQNIPQDSYVYKVILNGEEISKAQDTTGDGYTVDGQKVEIVGNARPDVTNSLAGVSLTVQYFDSLEISLNDHMPNNYFHNYCDHETGDSLTGAEIDPSHLAVSLDGNQLSTDQYSLQNSKIVLNKDSITLGAGNHTLSVDYRVRQAIGYEPNEFTFQVGANSGQNFKVEIASFDNLLRDTNIICVRNQEDAAQGLKIIDNALEFVLQELGNVGAVENRLDHIATNLSVTEENTVASMSRIHDTDMAKETMNLLKEQILSQAQQAMAVHLKQSQEHVLGLFK